VLRLFNTWRCACAALDADYNAERAIRRAEVLELQLGQKEAALDPSLAATQQAPGHVPDGPREYR